jgi:DNA-binding XRE family transcriptional regulator
MSKLSQSKQLKYKIKELLESEGANQLMLARYLDVSIKTMSNWCNIALSESSSIPGDHLIRIAFYFEITVEELHFAKQFEWEDG